MSDPFSHRLLSLARPRLSQIPGAYEQFECEVNSGGSGLSIELSVLHSQHIFDPAHKHDKKFLEWIDDFAEGFQPVQLEEEPTPPEPQAAAGEWVEIARNRAAEIVKEQRERDLYPSQESIADTIAAEFRKADIMGTDGKPLTGATIKRHALKGISSAAVKRLSTTIRRGK